MRDKCLAICKTNLSSKLESPCFALPGSPSFTFCVYTTPQMHIFLPRIIFNIMLNDDSRMHLQS